MIMQMRDYTVKPGCLDEYLTAWKERIYPLRLAHGFRIDGAWVAPDKNRFFWTLAYDGPEEFQAKNATYDLVRNTFVPDPALLLEEERKLYVQALPLGLRRP